MIRDYKTLHNLCCWAQSHCLMGTHYKDSHEVRVKPVIQESCTTAKKKCYKPYQQPQSWWCWSHCQHPSSQLWIFYSCLVVFYFLFLLHFLLQLAAHQVSCIIKDALESAWLRHAISYEDWTIREVVQFCLCQLLRYFLMYVLILIKRRKKVNVLGAACTL